MNEMFGIPTELVFLGVLCLIVLVIRFVFGKETI